MAIERLAGPVADARDVVETYRVARIYAGGWDTLLEEACASLAAAETVAGEVPVRRLAEDLNALRINGLEDEERIERASLDLRRLVDLTRVEAVAGCDRAAELSF